MDWRYYFTTQIVNYINRAAAEGITRLDQFLITYGEQLQNEVEEIVDQENAIHTSEELASLKTLIQLDGKIESEDPNTQRILQTIDSLIQEQSQEVDYTNDPE